MLDYHSHMGAAPGLSIDVAQKDKRSAGRWRKCRGRVLRKRPSDTWVPGQAFEAGLIRRGAQKAAITMTKSGVGRREWAYQSGLAKITVQDGLSERGIVPPRLLIAHTSFESDRKCPRWARKLLLVRVQLVGFVPASPALRSAAPMRTAPAETISRGMNF